MPSAGSVPAQWAFPGGRHAFAGRALRRARLPREDQVGSYTLRGRIESRLAALLPVVAAACVLAAAEHRWWPVEAVGLMLGAGPALDLQAYDRLLRYQPGVGGAAARRCSSSASCSSG